MIKRERLELALYQAIAHVRRQQFAGKHAQDRIDSELWQTEFKDVVDYVNEKFQANSTSKKRPS